MTRTLVLAAALLLAGLAELQPARSQDAGDRWLHAFGSAAYLGEPSPLPREVVALAAPRTGTGYWVAAADGSVFGFGEVGYFGSMGHVGLRSPVADMAARPGGGGYWLAAADGSIFGFGDAPYAGSMGGSPLPTPVGAMAATPTGGGYLLAALDGSVFGFGDARYFGSMGGSRLGSPVVDIAVTPSGAGYWLVAADGSVFGFGDAAYSGSAYGAHSSPVSAMIPTPSGRGYRLLYVDGHVVPFGDATALASPVGDLPREAAVVDLEATADGAGYWTLATPGAIRVSTTGDVHGEGRVRSLLERGGNPLTHVAGELVTDDVTVLNLETPVGPPGRPATKTYVFLAPESLLPALETGGTDFVNLANNHGLDHGVEAMLRTIDLSRRHGLVPVGGGRNRADAYSPGLIRSRGRTVAVVGLSRVLSPGWQAGPRSPGLASAYDEAAAVDAVRAADGYADVTVVAIHWGVERERCPDSHQRRLTQLLTDAGADVVAGHHPHVLQGLDPGPTAAVAYSLGNFVWYHSSGASGTTAVLRTEHPPAGGVRAQALPARIDTTGSPRFLSGAEADKVRADMASLRPGRGRC